MVNKKAVEDFKIFAEGVKRLKELEKELNGLDTRKFKNEAQNIRQKLKSVHMIPQIEREINELKAKISGVDINFLKSKLDFEQTCKIAELERKEQELERQILFARKGVLNEPQKLDVKNLPQLRNRVDYLRELISKEDRDIQKEIKNVRREKIRKQLTHSEVRDVESLPNFRGKIEYIRSLLRADEEKLAKFDSLDKKVEFALGEARKKELTPREKENIGAVPRLRERLSYLKTLIGDDRTKINELENLKPKIDLALEKASEKQLTKTELEEIESIPSIKGRLSYLKNLIVEDEARLNNYEAKLSEVDRIPPLQQRISYLRNIFNKENRQLKAEIEKLRNNEGKKLTEIELADVDSIPHLRGKIAYLKRLLDADEEKLIIFAENESRVEGKADRALSEIPNLSRKTTLLGRLFNREQDELQEIEKRIEKIPGLQGKITNLSKMLEEKSSEISKEAEEIDFLKHKLSYFKRILEEKGSEMEQELRKAQNPEFKKRMLQEINEIENKIDSVKSELYNKITQETSESKWMLQKQREELSSELKELAKASARIMENEKNETLKALISELTKVNQKIETNKNELSEQLARNIGDLRRKLNELEQTQRIDENRTELRDQVYSKFDYLKEKLDYLEKTQKIDEIRGNMRSSEAKFISRSKALGITPKYLQKIESLENLEPRKIKEINPIIKQKPELKIKFMSGGEIPELPAMPLSAEELQGLMPRTRGDNFMPDIRMETNVFAKNNVFRDPENPKIFSALTSQPSLSREKELDIYELKKEIEFREPKPRPIELKIEEKPKIEKPQKIIKRKVPNRKFLEQGRFFRFVNNLGDLKLLSENYEGLFEDVKELKNFNKNSAEKILEDSHLIRQNLLKINSKLLTGLRAQ